MYVFDMSYNVTVTLDEHAHKEFLERNVNLSLFIRNAMLKHITEHWNKPEHQETDDERMFRENKEKSEAALREWQKAKASAKHDEAFSIYQAALDRGLAAGLSDAEAIVIARKEAGFPSRSED